MTVFAEFPRYLQVEGTHLEIAADNQSGEDLEFTTLGLVVPGFEAIAPEVDDRLVRAGRRVDLQVPFGEAECDESPTEATVVGTIQSDGDETDVEISIDPAPLEQIHRESCGAIAVLEVVDVGFKPGLPS